MRLQTPQIDALQTMLRSPGVHVERRVDSLVDIGSRHSIWSCRLQVLLPVTAFEMTELIVSIGIFRKERLPDLEVRDGAGVHVPLLSRTEQGDVLAAALLRRFTKALSPDQKVELLECAWSILSSSPAAAASHLSGMADKARAVGLGPADVDELVGVLAPFVDNVQVLAAVRKETGQQRVMLSVQFSEDHVLGPTWGGDGAPGVVSPKLRDRLSEAGLSLLMHAGLLALPVHMRLGNANHAQSYYFLLRAPEGVEVECLYWNRLKVRPGSRSSLYEAPKSQASVLACYHAVHDVQGGDARIKLRLFGPGLRLIWLLTLLVTAIGVYTAFAISNGDGDGQVSAWVPVVPGLLLASMNERSSELKQYMARYLQRAVLGLAVLSLVVGFRSAFERRSTSGGWGALEWLAKIDASFLAAALAGYGAALVVILGAIAFRRSPEQISRFIDTAHAQSSDYYQHRWSQRRVASMVMTVAVVAAVTMLLALHVSTGTQVRSMVTQLALGR
jgi:hypothetical protein